MTIESTQLAEQGKNAFKDKKFEEAVKLFEQAAEGFTSAQNSLMAAEMKNNVSVALVQLERYQEALHAALNTDVVFAAANDIKREAMALGNQAAALDGLRRYDEAIAKYERSADLFGQAGEGDLRAMVSKSAAAIKLKTGKITESAFKMMGALEAKDTPSIFERILRFFLRLIK